MARRSDQVIGAQPLAQQRRALAPRGCSRRSARRSASRSSTVLQLGWSSRGRSPTSSTSVRFDRPRRHRRPDPHLRAVVVRTSTTRARSSTSGDTVKVKVLDIDRDRQRSLAGSSSRPKRTRGSGSSTPTTSATSSPARSRRVVTFGAFVEILDGVEGLVHHLRACCAPCREPGREDRPPGAMRSA